MSDPIGIGEYDTRLSPWVEVDFRPSTEARGVVVSKSLRVTERLQHGISVENALLDVVLRV